MSQITATQETAVWIVRTKEGGFTHRNVNRNHRDLGGVHLLHDLSAKISIGLEFDHKVYVALNKGFGDLKRGCTRTLVVTDHQINSSRISIALDALLDQLGEINGAYNVGKANHILFTITWWTVLGRRSDHGFKRAAFELLARKFSRVKTKEIFGKRRGKNADDCETNNDAPRSKKREPMLHKTSDDLPRLLLLGVQVVRPTIISYSVFCQESVQVVKPIAKPCKVS